MQKIVEEEELDEYQFTQCFTLFEATSDTCHTCLILNLLGAAFKLSKFNWGEVSTYSVENWGK